MTRDESQPDLDAPVQPSDDLRGVERIRTGFAHRDDPELGESLHSHVALLYADADEQFAAVLPLLRDGLDRGDRCYYVHDDNSRDDVEDAMRGVGIGVDAAVQTGALSFHTPEELFLQDGTFDPEHVVTATRETIRETTGGDGYDTIRMFGEMTWVLDGDHSLDRMVAYERTLNAVYEDRPVVGVCQYNVTRFDPEIVNQLVRAHPNLVYGGATARHLYYLPDGDGGGGPVRTPDADDPSDQSFFERIRAYETLERREQSLRALNEASQELMYLDAADIADRVADIVRDVLDVAFASIWTYNEDTGELELASRSSVDDAEVTGMIEQYEDCAWDAFVTEQPDVRTDLDAVVDASGPRLRSGIIVPLGRHGVFCAGSLRPGDFDDATVNLATTVGANVEAALDRAERERTLEDKNDQLERLNHLNHVIREIDRALVDATTQTEIEQLVCERLAAADPYEFVWIGERRLETDEVVPRARAGDYPGYLDRITVTTDDTPTGRGPVSTALKTHEVQVVQDVLTDPAFAPWREATLSHDLRACVSVPLVYEESLYGVLTLYTGIPNAFDDLERTVLAELGETIAHAIDAAQTRQTLQSDSVTELVLEIANPDDALVDLARTADARIEFEGLAPQQGTDGPVRVFFSAIEATPNDVRSAVEDVPGIGRLELVRTAGDDGQSVATFEATVTRRTVAAHTVERQGLVRSLKIEDDAVTLVVDVPCAGDVREFVEHVREDFPNTELVKRRTRDRQLATRQDLQVAVRERLTDRQLEVLQTAYLSGFFESPRVRTGAELADALDVAQSTFTYHLREAQRQLCEFVFENT